MNITMTEALGYSVLGFSIVFLMLIILMGIIIIMGKIMEKKQEPAKAAAPAPVALLGCVVGHWAILLFAVSTVNPPPTQYEPAGHVVSVTDVSVTFKYSPGSNV